MSHRPLFWAFFPAALLAATAADARGGWHHGHGVSTSGGREGITRCSQWHVEFGDRDAITAEESVTVPVSEGSPLRLSPSENGGATIIGSDGKDFEISVCKAAPEGESGVLGEIRTVREHGSLAVEGPSGSDWVAHLIVRAPKNASVDVRTGNGPVAVTDFVGRAKISSDNGPVSLRRSSGEIEVHTTNGPIGFEGGSGSVHLEAENGPLTVRLPDGRWQGGGFEGRTQNGPVHLEIAENFVSGVVVETAGHSPFHCGAEACRHARRNWDDDGKSIAFGPETAVVRLATQNGPVSIGD
ncbi:MAG TPA: hypothetical protein VFS34_09480 [Thermoanaerobaculia bacterium]|nr:hypothetical protein [Thermoanaerobaculia bacterium]